MSSKNSKLRTKNNTIIQLPLERRNVEGRVDRHRRLLKQK